MAEAPRSVKVNSTPPRRIRKIIGDTSLTLRDAVAEIVANSLDARENEDDRISVDILLSGEEVLVVDDAMGMTLEVLTEAIRLGVDMGEVTGRRTDRMGYFGLGMKTACASIGDWWSVITRSKDSGTELVVEFDLLQDETSLDSSLWEDEIMVREPDLDGPLGDRQHGTAVIIRKLHDRNPLPGGVIDRLGKAFKGFLGQGDIIKVNGTICSPPVFRFIPGSRVEFDIPLSGNDPTRRISGWLGLLSDVSTKHDRGFNIYRKGQLVQAWNTDWYSYHPETSYLIGDVNLDFIRANFFKKGLQEQSEEWVAVKRVMKEYIKPAVAAARKARKCKTELQEFEVVNAMRQEMGFEPYMPPGSGKQDNDTNEPGDTSEGSGSGSAGGEDAGEQGESARPPKPRIRVTLKALVLENGQEVTLGYTEEAWDTQLTPWDGVKDTSNQLVTVGNTESELYKLLGNARLFLALAVSDSIAHFLIKFHGKNVDEAKAIKNEWLHKFLVSEEVQL